MKNLVIIIVLYVFVDLNAQEEFFTDEWILGDALDSNTEYIFQNPEILKTDSIENVYIKDKSSQSIRKFSPNGEFICNIGNLGRGPGEFQDIISFEIINDKIKIFDRGNQKFSEFDINGNFIKDYRISDEYLSCFSLTKLTASEIFALDISQIFNDEKFLIKIFSKDYEVIHELGEIDKIVKNDFWEKRILAFKKLKLCLVDTSNIYFTKGLFDGNIYHLQKMNMQWRLIKNQYKKLKHKASQNIDLEEAKRMYKTQKFKYPLAIMSGSGSQNAIKVNNISLGLFKYSESDLIHFHITCIGRNKYLFFVDVIDKNLNLLNTIELGNYNTSNVHMFKKEILHIDRDLNFYIKDVSKNNFPIIVKGKFNLNFDKK